ncbi:MAG: hypothetical protein Q4D61_08460 [Cardiobacteriaceae bacterium]|nr:hypothetical protein [Cardiobacteriaceae bacterium]
MTFVSDGYRFKPHEQPIMSGSPASPDHPPARRAAYLGIGLFLSLTAGLQNGLLMAALPQLRGALGLTLQEGGWIQVAYYMTYACMSILFFKIRQHCGLQPFVRSVLALLLLGNVLQLAFPGYVAELLARGFAGVAASGLMVLSMFYMMQAFTGQKKLAGVLLGLGVMQLGMPLAQAMLPALFADGNIDAVFWLLLGLTLLCIAFVRWLPMPPGPREHALGWLDCLSFALFAGGAALLCAFMVQGRIVWWDTPWLGWLLAGGIALGGTALLIEAHRKHPMLDWRWMSMPQIAAFALTGAAVRLLTSEQTVGAAGLMATLGMGSAQMARFYWIVFAASTLGVIMSLVRLDVDDIRRPVVVALLGIAAGAWLDMDVGLQTRPAQLYLSQAIIAFSALYFLGPMLLEGLVRALAKGPQYLMSFSAVFGISQTLGGLAGAALFSAFLTIRTRAHLADITQHFTLADSGVAHALQTFAQPHAAYSSDAAILQGQAISTLMAQALREAAVIAYHDFFTLIGALAFAAFLVNAALWAYRRYRRIDIIAEEKQKLFALLNL